ncbi:MAG TPA: hypothetical protein PKE12_06605 [Kiritimatiellia bacterium]|nr:hypothetical protein [Kiritimatiellia bacterium]
MRNYRSLVSRMLVVTIMMGWAGRASAEDGTVKQLLDVQIGQIKAKGESAALALGSKLENSMPTDSIEAVGHGMYHNLLPKFDLTESESRFEHVYLGVEGFTIIGDILPYSVGIEGSRNLDSYAGLAEIGWMPGLRPKDTLAGFVQRAFFADEAPFVLQAGYKFAASTNEEEGVTSGLDESGEKEDDAIFRARFSASLKTESAVFARLVEGTYFDAFLGPDPQPGDVLHMSISAKASVWYSFVEAEFYEAMSVTLDLASPKLETAVKWFKNKKINLAYNWGSGAPNFNKDEYFTAALKMSL